jgi:hypothetical protein
MDDDMLGPTFTVARSETYGRSQASTISFRLVLAVCRKLGLKLSCPVKLYLGILTA